MWRIKTKNRYAIKWCFFPEQKTKHSSCTYFLNDQALIWFLMKPESAFLKLFSYYLAFASSFQGVSSQSPLSPLLTKSHKGIFGSPISTTSKSDCRIFSKTYWIRNSVVRPMNMHFHVHLRCLYISLDCKSLYLNYWQSVKTTHSY